MHFSVRPSLLAAIALLGSASAMAQSSPYYLGVAQSIATDSNIYRISDSQVLGAGRSKSDTIFTTSLVAGVDQTWGRQRLSGSGSLRASKFADNKALDNNGYGVNLGLDWATIERLSGRLGLDMNRSLRRFDQTGTNQGTERNVEDNNQISAVVRLGVVTRLTAEAGLSRRSVRFSANAFRASEYDQSVASLGGRYRLGGATTLGLTWRESKVDYVTGSDAYKRRDIDLSANWVPSGLSTVYARISHSSTSHDLRQQLDFSGFTAELRASTQITGKIKLGAAVSRDTGQSYSTFDLGQFSSAAEFSRVSTLWRATADYELSAKINLNASIEQTRRDLSAPLTPDFTLADNDRTLVLSLGARWQPWRSTQLGCNATHEKRSVGAIGLPYTANGLSCYGQFIFQ